MINPTGSEFYDTLEKIGGFSASWGISAYLIVMQSEQGSIKKVFQKHGVDWTIRIEWYTLQSGNVEVKIVGYKG